MRRTTLGTVLATALLSLAFFAGPSAPEASAGGLVLDGRMAPEMVFPGGVTGLPNVRKLSDLKGRVVWVKFWLRDCPVCRATLPALQEAQERWGHAGLVVLSVIHQFQPADYMPVMQQLGYSFPVGTDADGSQARPYGVQHRPADYLVGIDGRIKSSNGVPQDVLLAELSRFRVARLGKVPDALASTRDAVARNDLGSALRTAEAAGGAADASEETKSALARILRLAEEDVAARTSWATYLVRKRRSPEARTELDALAASYRGTGLEAKANEARTSLLPR